MRAQLEAEPILPSDREGVRLPFRSLEASSYQEHGMTDEWGEALERFDKLTVKRRARAKEQEEKAQS
jgi:hypothetical protein